MLRTSAPLAVLIAALALTACNHGGSRYFSFADPDPGPVDPDPPPVPPPPPPERPPGPLRKTTDATTGLVGGVLHVAGNIVMGVGEHTNLPAGHVGETIAGLGDDLGEGVEGVPLVGGALDKTVTTGDARLASAAQVNVVGLPAISGAPGGAPSAVGVSIAGPPAPGSVASVGLLGPGATQAANVSLGGAQILGNEGQPAAVKVGLLNGASQQGGGGQPSGPANPVSQVLGGVGGLLGH